MQSGDLACCIGMAWSCPKTGSRQRWRTSGLALETTWLSFTAKRDRPGQSRCLEAQSLGTENPVPPSVARWSMKLAAT